MPIPVATGNNIGVAIKINGAISITMPRSNKITRIISIVMASFGEKLIIVSDTIAGTFNKASNQPNADEAPIKNKRSEERRVGKEWRYRWARYRQRGSEGK